MKLSKKTHAVLKNFASINQSIVLKPGSNIETISNLKDVYAKFEAEETFEKEVAIYDLNAFLGVLSLFEDADLEFGDKSVIISQGNQKQQYFYADASVITSPPEKGVNLPSVEVTARLLKEQLTTLVKAASANGATDLTFSDGSVKVHDKTVPNSNSFTLDRVADEGDYNLSISVEKLKMVVDDYEIEICSKGLARFIGSEGVEYFIALQPDGTYNGG